MCLDPNERTPVIGRWNTRPLLPDPSIYLSVHSGKSNEHKVSYRIVDLKTESPPPPWTSMHSHRVIFFPNVIRLVSVRCVCSDSWDIDHMCADRLQFSQRRESDVKRGG